MRITFIGAIGEDGSGCHGQRQGRDIHINTRNRIIAGFRVGRIVNAETNQLIYQELSQGAESERPFAIIPGSESRERVEELWDTILTELEEAKVTDMEYLDKAICVTFEFTLQGDGKERKQLSGCGGAYCLFCYATEEDGNNLDRILEGFPIERSIDKTWETYDMLTKDDTQPIPKKTKDQDVRKGITQRPLIKKRRIVVIDPHRGNGSMHFIIHVFDFFKKLFE